MFQTLKLVLLCVIVILLKFEICSCEAAPSLVLYSPGEPEYPDVVVRRVGENLTLVCELRGDSSPRVYVWNYVGGNASSAGRPLEVEPTGPTSSSRLERTYLTEGDSGHYMCSAPPFSVTKYILVQPLGPKKCARGAFTCGSWCVLGSYVCDGWPDCAKHEDEAPHMCSSSPCNRSDKLNCSSGRCISESACCRSPDPICPQHECCDEYPRYSRHDGFVEVEYPPLFEDRHAPDDYGFIQSTIYTVTACALIFMIAVVLLVSALCKMHMKRAALRNYAAAHRATHSHYASRFPPRYEATRLLDTPPLPSPTRNNQCVDNPQDLPEVCAEPSGFGLARLSAIFSSRYRQVPTQCDVEMTDVRSTSLNSSPVHQTLDYQSPTFEPELYFTNPDISNCGRELNYMATPVEFFRRRTLRRNTLDRVLDLQRPLTLQLGRFQLSIPRFGRREEPRPDTPNVAEINIDNLDFVRLNSNETYTLNGRTIRLLGANFENYPVLDATVRPPPYNEAMRYKVYGPPPEYLSREGLNVNNATNIDEEARNNVEMPPCYDELASASNVADISNGNVSDDNGNTSNVNNGDTRNVNNVNSSNVNNVILVRNFTVTENGNSSDVANDNVTGNVSPDNIVEPNSNLPESISSIIDNLPAIDSDVNANEAGSIEINAN